MVQGSKSRKVAGSGAENAEEDEEDQDYPDAGSSEEDDNVKVPSKRRGKTPTREQRMTTRPQKVWPYLGCLCAACAVLAGCCLLYTSPSPRDRTRSRMPSSA